METKQTPKNPTCDCGNPKARWYGPTDGLRQFMCGTCWENKRLRECAEYLIAVVEDVMPQIGRIVLQDYSKLNCGLILARELGLMRKPSKSKRGDK